MQKRNSSVSKKLSQATLPALAAASAALMVMAAQASAATLTYDADTTAPANDGTGVWNTTTANWFDGTNDVPWSNGPTDTAIFGASPTGITANTFPVVTVGTVNVGTIQFNQASTAVVGPPAVAAGGYTLSGGTITLGTGITSAATGTTTINSVITGTNGLAFNGVGTVQVALNGANTYSGITTLSATGRLGMGNVNAFGTAAGATATSLGTDYTQVTSGGAIQMSFTGATNEAFLINGNGGSSTTGAFRINNAPIYNSLVRLGSTSQIFNNGGGAVVFNGNVDAQTFALNLNTFSGTPATTAGIIQASTTGMTFNGPITGTTGSVAIQGSGAIYLFNGANTYTGPTTVTGSYLGGTGSLASSLTTITSSVTGANSNTVGTLSFSKALTINGADIADLTATGSDTLAVGTTLTLGAASLLKLQGTTGAASYTLATFATLAGTFSTANITYNGVAGLPAGYVLNYNPTSITLTNPSLLPEPATLAAIGAGAVSLLRRRRRA